MKPIGKMLLFLFVAVLCACTSSAQTSYTSTLVRVDIGVATRAKFCFGPVSSPCIGQTVVFVNYPDNSYQVILNYGTTNQQGSAAIPLTYTVTRGSDPDHDSNQLTSVTVTSAQSGTIGSQTFTLTSASFQSEQVGMHNQNETLGGSATLTVSPSTDQLVGGGTGGGGKSSAHCVGSCGSNP